MQICPIQNTIYLLSLLYETDIGIDSGCCLLRYKRILLGLPIAEGRPREVPQYVATANYGLSYRACYRFIDGGNRQQRQHTPARIHRTPSAELRGSYLHHKIHD